MTREKLLRKRILKEISNKIVNYKKKYKMGTRNMTMVIIAESTEDEILIFNREQTAKEDGWVEFSYVVNLQDNTFSVYELLDKPVIKVYNLSELPDEKEFIKEIETLVYGAPEADEE